MQRLLRQVAKNTCHRKFSFSTAASDVARSSSPRAACCIIGNEVLNGKVQDINTHYLAKLLFKNGVDLIRVETITDDVNDIADSVKALSERVGPDGFVFTSGGIGPTHDDVTYEGIARAFGRGLEVHQPTVELMNKYRSQPLNDASLRMAILPSGSTVRHLKDHWIPFVNVENVYILPGVPRFFQIILAEHQGLFKGTPVTRSLVGTMLPESQIAAELEAAQKAYPHISIGSYPRVSDDETRFNVMISIEGRDIEGVRNLAERLKGSLDGKEVQPV